MALSDDAMALSHDAAFWLSGVRDPGYPLKDLGNLALEVGGKLRAMAIITLLADANTNGFCHNLIRSAMARLRFLERCHQEGGTAGRQFVAGRFVPLVDALAAGDFAVALRLDAAGPADFRDGFEYEDDFCFAKALGSLASGRADAARLTPLIDRFEAYLEGVRSARLTLLRAFATADAAAFDEGFEERLVERELEIEVRKQEGEVEEPQVLAERRVFVEGVAFLRLATLHGLATRPDYRLCPSLARLPMTRPFPGE